MSVAYTFLSNIICVSLHYNLNKKQINLQALYIAKRHFDYGCLSIVLRQTLIKKIDLFHVSLQNSAYERL